MSTAKRQTQQRMAVRTAMEEMDCTFTPQELLDHARRAVSGLGIATVYRFLRDLLEEGRIQRVVVADGAPRYERTDVKHHHHFHCESCGKVIPLEGCALKKSYRLPSGFTVSAHDITFTGTCPACVDSDVP